MFVELKPIKEYLENETVKVCANIQGGCYPSAPFSIHIYSRDESADSSDYEAVDTLLTFTPSDNIPCVTVNITDDEVVEQKESFNVFLERTPGLNERVVIVPEKSKGEVVIKNDDSMFAIVLYDVLK